MNTVWKPYISFIDQSQSYSLGVEAGMIYQRMQSETDFEALCREENREQLCLMATRLGFSAEFASLGAAYDEWLIVRFEKQVRRVK